MASSFIGASHTFTVYRRNQTTVGVNGNIIPVSPNSKAPVATGEAIALKDQPSIIATEKGATVLNAAYLGTTRHDTPILIGDLIADETENGADGHPVEYEVQLKTVHPLGAKLHLRRTDVGA